MIDGGGLFGFHVIAAIDFDGRYCDVAASRRTGPECRRQTIAKSRLTCQAVANEAYARRASAAAGPWYQCN